MPSPCEITAPQLARLVGTPDVPVLVDLRIDEDFDDDPRLVPGAFRHSFHALEELAHRLSGKRAVLYCQKGRKISQGAMTLLRGRGIAAEVLEGGQSAWREAGLPMVDASALPGLEQGGTRWVTRQRPKIDRIACPWLIRRFIDPAASFLFVPRQDVALVAEKFDAIPFDVEDVRFSHVDDRCSFDTMLEIFGLVSDPLSALATVIRAADTNHHDLAPEAAGLLAFSVGLSRMMRDDHAQLEAGMMLYDALYRWARDGQGEGHDWLPMSVSS